jgi:hypothetical protein
MLALGNVQSSLSLLSLTRIFHDAKLRVLNKVHNRYVLVFFLKELINICVFA